MVTHLDYLVWRDLLALPSLPDKDRRWLDSLAEVVVYTPAEQQRINRLWDRYIGPEAQKSNDEDNRESPCG